MSPEANFSQLILWIVNVLNLKIFASNLSFIYLAGSGYVFGIWIRIHKGPEYGSILDPDPQRWQEYEKKKVTVSHKPAESVRWRFAQTSSMEALQK